MRAIPSFDSLHQLVVASGMPISLADERPALIAAATISDENQRLWVL